MSRLLMLILMSLMSALLASCSDLGASTGGTGGIGGTAETGGAGGSTGIVDPGPKTRTLALGCADSTSTLIRFISWELTVDPGPIVAGEAFGVTLRSRAVFNETFLDLAQPAVPGGFKRIELLELNATVHVRAGATGPDVLLFSSPIPTTCTYDDGGNTDPDVESFPTCSQTNDNPDGSNEDCTGLGGTPSPENPCGQFGAIPTSSDCAPEGECDTLDGGFGVKNDQCEANRFCVTGSLEVPLEGSVEAPQGYTAAGSGSVFFGWDDESTGAELDHSGGDNDGTWILPPAVFEEETGPNGYRVRVAGLPFAVECTMGVNSRGSAGIGSRDALSSPTPDSKLIWFPIQTR